MLTAYVLYQLVDLAFGALLFAGVLRVVRRVGPLRARPFARYLAFEVPLVLLVLLAACVLWRTPGQWLCDRALEALGVRPVSVKFIGVGAAFWTGAILLPLVGLRRAWRHDPSAVVGRADSPAHLSPPERRARVTAVAWVLASAALIVETVLLEPSDLEVVTHDVPTASWPAHVPPLRIAVVADVQSPLYGRRERAVVRRVGELEPDLILLPGDLVGQNLDGDAGVEAGRRLLRALVALAPRCGVHVVEGDVDELVGGGIEDVVRDTGATLVDNRQLVFDVGARFELAGFDPREELVYERALSRRPGAPLRIALVHRPRYAERIARSGYDLVVAGHTHGGQIVVPGFGPPVTASPLPRRVAAGGASALPEGARLIVSRGVGLEAGFAPPIRFFCRPELTLVRVGRAGRGAP